MTSDEAKTGEIAIRLLRSFSSGFACTGSHFSTPLHLYIELNTVRTNLYAKLTKFLRNVLSVLPDNTMSEP